jgi:HAD superfamily hydrolase (TIGR01509 family)
VTGLPAAVLFDMDGLLVDTEHVWFEVESALVAELGGSWGTADQQALVGGPLERTLDHIAATVPGPVSPAELRERLLADMVGRLRRGPVRWMPGARRLLDETSAAGVPRALVSSSLRVVVDAVLDAIGREQLPVTVSGDDVARTKPHPDPYLLAARTLGVDPASCVALEDSATGATSARAAGCYTIAVPSLAEVPPGIAHHQVASLEELDLASLADLVGARA